MVEEKETKTKEVEERWSVRLAIIDESTPPQKVIVDGTAEEGSNEGNLDLHSAIVKLLNNQEKLMQLLD